MKRFKKLAAFLTAALLCGTMSVSVFADEPYEAYSYDYFYDSLPAQNGYIVDKVITGSDMGLAQLSDPESPLFISETESSSLIEAKDMFVTEDNDIFIVDAGRKDTNGSARIIILDSSFKVKKVIKEFNGGKVADANGEPITYLKDPRGIFVANKNGDEFTMYIADYDNSRVIKCDQDGNIETEYTKPTSEVYTFQTFNPKKVVVDGGGNIYVVAQSVNNGAVMFNAAGEFLSFYGANRVEVTASVRVQRMWRKLFSDEQRSASTRTTPVEYENFDIDNDGFIYTVTEAANASTDAVKKLNPAGYNIWDNNTGNTYVFGDKEESVWYGNKTYSTRLTDVAVSSDGIINILDYTSGKIFQYDKEANLMFIFGTSSSDQRGGFSAPNAIETFGDRILVVDGQKNDLTIFKRTVFGEYVHNAVELHNMGLYEEAVEPWTEVLKRDGNFVMAYTGIGRALLNQGEYKQAMEYFENSFNQEDYDRAFEGYRQKILRDNFTGIVFGVLIFIVVYTVLRQLCKRKTIVIPTINFKKRSKKEDK